MDEDEESDYASAEEADAPTITSTNQEPGTENEKVSMLGPWLKDLVKEIQGHQIYVSRSVFQSLYSSLTNYLIYTLHDCCYSVCRLVSFGMKRDSLTSDMSIKMIC